MRNALLGLTVLLLLVAPAQAMAPREGKVRIEAEPLEVRFEKKGEERVDYRVRGSIECDAGSTGPSFTFLVVHSPSEYWGADRLQGSVAGRRESPTSSNYLIDVNSTLTIRVHELPPANQTGYLTFQSRAPSSDGLVRACSRDGYAWKLEHAANVSVFVKAAPPEPLDPDDPAYYTRERGGEGPGEQAPIHFTGSSRLPASAALLLVGLIVGLSFLVLRRATR